MSDSTIYPPRLTGRGLISQHLQAFVEGFQKLSANPFASLMTIFVISIALLLPTGLLVLLNNTKVLAGGWHQATAISVYLQQNISDDQANALANDLRKRADIANVKYITPAEGLKEFQENTGFKQVITALSTNPLPGVLEVVPAVQDQLDLSRLQLFLQQLPQVAQVQLDMQWVNRLYGILNLANRIVYSIMVLLAAGVLLIIGNTLRLALQKYHLEISVIKLIGGSNSYIRRPFLYAGILYGLTAGIVAWLLLDTFISWLQIPVANLSQLYGSQFQLHSLNLSGTAILLLCSILLGFVGTWLAVGIHLANAEAEY